MASSLPWTTAGTLQIERVAEWLYPMRFALMVAAFGTALVGLAPFMLLLHAAVELPHAFLWAGAFVMPLSLWPLGALLLAAWFEPVAGSLGLRNDGFRQCPPALRRSLRALAQCTLVGFGIAPLVVFGAGLLAALG